MSTITIDNQGIVSVTYPGQPDESHILQAADGTKWTLLGNGTTGEATITDGATGTAEEYAPIDSNGIPWDVKITSQYLVTVTGFELVVILAPIVNIPILWDGMPADGYTLAAYNPTTGNEETLYKNEGFIARQTNPVRLNQFGMPEHPIFVVVGRPYEFRLSPPNGGPVVMTLPYVVGGIQASVVSPTEWSDPPIPCRYLTGSSVALVGDVRDIFPLGRRVKITGSAVSTATITGSTFTAGTTTVSFEVTPGDPAVDISAATLTYGLLSPSSASVPGRYHAGTTTILTGSLTVPKAQGLNLLPCGAITLHLNPLGDGWLQCNGQAVSRTTYATLFATIGTTFGAGDGSTTFNVPTISAIGSLLYGIYAKG